MTDIVSCQDLYKFHEQGDQKVPILREVSFEVKEGEFLCIMGPSGSGKSTLLHLISGLDEPSGGKVLLHGKDMAQMAERQRTLMRRKTVGYVFQFFNLMPNLTAAENIGLPLAIAGERPEDKQELLDALAAQLGLENRLAAFPHQLSGGEMQRVSIARALVGGQPLLLCDEPTGNLSQKAGEEVMQILRRCAKEDGRSILLVTHNPRDAAFADRVLFLVDGELAHDATLEGPDLCIADVHGALAGLAI